MLHEKLVGAALPWLALVTAVLLAGAAAYFSILGLTTVFIGAVIPVAIMASLIEAAKLIGVSWVYRHYSIAPKWLIGLITTFVVVAMLVTSLGIFGFLARAYTEHAADNQHIEIEINRLDERIESLQERRDRAQSNLDQINESLNTLIEYDRISGPQGYRAVREQNLPTIEEMESIVESTSTNISEVTQDRLDLERKLAVAEAEMGPIRFVSELIWGSDDARQNYDRAVQILILILVFIFDPFAIGLLVAANHSLMLRSKQKEEANNRLPPPSNDGGDDTPIIDPSPEPEPSEEVAEPEPESESPAPESYEKKTVKSTGLLSMVGNTKAVVGELISNLPKKIKRSHGVIDLLNTRSKIRYNNTHL